MNRQISIAIRQKNREDGEVRVNGMESLRSGWRLSSPERVKAWFFHYMAPFKRKG